MRKNVSIFFGLIFGVGLWGCVTTNPPSMSASSASAPASASAAASAPSGLPADCPQPKFTGRAPEDIYNRANPLTNINAKLGEQLYFDEVPGRYSCATCHGRSGNGKGPMSSHFTPPPRNLACIRKAGITDGQVFWTIKNGSPGTDMPAHKNFNDEQIWQIVAYVRAF
jgi:mono/diheme cytochrome c family protein